MINQQLFEAVKLNLEWFRNSGVMSPSDGSWGVAERIAITKDNVALEKTCRAFPAWNEFEGYCIIEQRRPDCNFEAALLFLLAGEKFESTEFTRIGENLLMYLYNRSGMEFPESGVWNWSNITKQPCRWFDDNGWCGFIQLRIAALRPDLNIKYHMQERALRLSRLLAAGVDRSLDIKQEISHGNWPDPEGFWLGEPRLPHWGAVALLAGTAALSIEHDPVISIQLRRYYEYVDNHLDSFIASELCYALLGGALAANVTKENFYYDLTARIASAVLQRIDPATGNLPAEHCEAPQGAHLVDLIYTANWALLGLQAAAEVCKNEAIYQAYRKLLKLLSGIQDKSDNPAFNGCWRGMYDIQCGTWGGGDLFEGGQNSIYTGWTNAPITLGLLFALNQTSLAAL